MMTLSGQPSKILIDRKDALKVLAAADSGRVYKRQVEQLQVDIGLLTDRIKEKENIITDLTTKDSLNDKIFDSFTREIFVMKEQRKLFEKQIRKLKRKAFFSSAIGLLGIGTLAYLYVTK